jgi:hypothetical protein
VSADIYLNWQPKAGVAMGRVPTQTRHVGTSRSVGVLAKYGDPRAGHLLKWKNVLPSREKASIFF